MPPLSTPTVLVQPAKNFYTAEWTLKSSEGISQMAFGTSEVIEGFYGIPRSGVNYLEVRNTLNGFCRLLKKGCRPTTGRISRSVKLSTILKKADNWFLQPVLNLNIIGWNVIGIIRNNSHMSLTHLYPTVWRVRGWSWRWSQEMRFGRRTLQSFFLTITTLPYHYVIIGSQCLWFFCSEWNIGIMS